MFRNSPNGWSPAEQRSPNTNDNLARSKGRIQELEEQLKQQQEAVNHAERQEELSNALRRRSEVANDLLALSTGILDKLKSDHVQRVSERMNQIFLDIVGADPTADSSLFSGVNIVSGSYDVVVHAQEGRTLDVVTDLNGASKRALTLSLIWALMEVADKGSAAYHRFTAGDDVWSGQTPNGRIVDFSHRRD